MREASGGLLVSRILVVNETPHSVLRVELANSQPRLDPDEWPDPQDRPVQVLRADELAEMAGTHAVDGLLFVGKRSAIGRSGLPGFLRRLRPHYPGWIGLEAVGPEPHDLQALLCEPLLSFLDVRLAWHEADFDGGEGTVLVDPSLRQVVSILLEARCPCVMRYTRPEEEDLFNEVSSAFDAFVRISSEPVAVRVLEPQEDGCQDKSCAVGLTEFIACRPAWLVRQSPDKWYHVQPEGQGLPQPRGQSAACHRRRRRPRTESDSTE